MVSLETLIQFVRPVQLKAVLRALFSTSAGHDHDGTNSKLVSVGGVAPGAIGNTELADDVKVGSLADLTTTEDASVVGALNEVDGIASAAYVLPVDGIPLADLIQAAQDSLALADSAYQFPVGGITLGELVQAVQDSLALADTSLQGAADLTNVRMGRVQLRGTADTPVVFQEDTAATLTSTNQGPFDCSGVGSGGTILCNTDDIGEDTATLEATAGSSISGADPGLDIHLETDNAFMISVDGDDPEKVELVLANCTSGAATAAEMQTQIRALTGKKALVTVDYDSTAPGKYAILSPTLGTDSEVVVTDSLTLNIAEELKIGEANGGVETGGTGDCGDITAVTCDELVTLLTGDLGDLTPTNADEYLVLTSKTEGRGSSLVMGNSTLKTVVGLADAAANYGAQGLGYASDMADALYNVQLTIYDTAAGSLADIAVGVNDLAASGFSISCETAADESKIMVTVHGVAA